MINIDVLIIYEHVSRELESAVLLKKKLEKRGLRTRIAQYGWSEPAARFLYNPKIIIAPWCYDDIDYEFFREFVGGYDGGRFKLINIHCEQIGNSEDSGFMLPSGKAKEVYHFVWGEYFKEKLLGCGTDINKIFITGNIRLDFFRDTYKKISVDKKILIEKYNLDNCKKWILIIGSFSGDVLQGKDISQLQERGINNIDTWKKIMLDSYYNILNWMEYICNKEVVSNDYEIIYRPHPSECITDNLREIEKKFSNFHIIGDYAIRDWMINVDKLYAWNSTSAVEAIYSDKPIIFLRPIEIPENFRSPLLEKVVKITNPKQFYESIFNEDDKDDNFNKEFKEDVNFYYHKDETTSVYKMVKLIVEIYNKDENYVYGKISMTKRIFLFIKYIIKCILKKVGLLRFFPNVKRVADDVIGRKELRELITRINSIGDVNER